MAYPVFSQLAADTFQRADENPLNSANWSTPTNASPLQIVSNIVEPVNGFSSFSMQVYTGVSWSNDQYSETVLGSIVSGDAGPVVRASLTGQTFYYAQESATVLTLYKVIAGTPTSLGAVSIGSANPGDIVRLAVQGSSLSVFLNNALLISATDSSIASGTPGLRIEVTGGNVTNASVSSWSGGQTQASTLSSTASDNFHRANENPLANGVWTTADVDAMKIVSNQVTPVSLNVFGSSDYTGASFSVNQYSQITVGTGFVAAGTGFVASVLRGTLGTNTFYTALVSSSGQVIVSASLAGNANPLAPAFSIIVADGDVFLFSVIGTNLYLYQNSTLIGYFSDSNISSGAPGILGLAVGALSSAPISAWLGGSQTPIPNPSTGSSLSGNIGVEGQPLPGATLTWSGTASGSTVTDSFGNWTTGLTLINGSYFLVPSLSGYTFLPPSFTRTISGQNVVGINFLGVPALTENNANVKKELHIEYTGAPALVQSDINTPDNKNGSSTVQIVNENVPLAVTPPVGIPQPGKFGTVHGRFDTFSILNNPDRILKPFDR